MSDWPTRKLSIGLYDAPGAARIYDPRAVYRGRFKEPSGGRVTFDIIVDGRMKIIEDPFTSFMIFSDPSSCFGSKVGIPEFWATLFWTEVFTWIKNKFM